MQLIDLWNATENYPEARGCPRCEDACYFSNAPNDTNKCGNEGVCRNPIVAATDQYVCTCLAGYQPVILKDQYNGYKLNASAPCVQGKTNIFRLSYISVHLLKFQIKLRTSNIYPLIYIFNLVIEEE